MTTAALVQEAAALDATDRAILDRLQDGVSLCERPFAPVAQALGLSEDELIARLERLLASGVLTRFGPLFDAEKLGGGLTLAAMEVPAVEFEHVAAIVNAHPEVAHNYARDHRLNMWFVVAAERPEDVARVLADIARATGLAVYDMPKQDEYFIGLRLAA
jgi:DNA-binding Lrp family transcriptional regulator